MSIISAVAAVVLTVVVWVVAYAVRGSF